MLSGNDLFQVEKHFELSGDHFISLIKLYQPILGSDAVLLYLTLTCETQNSHDQLSLILNKDIPAIERARSKLEEVLLLESYRKDSDYMYILNRPLNSLEFLHHEVLGRLLIYTLGRGYYQERLNENTTLSKEGFVNISSKIDRAFLSHWSESQEKVFQKKEVNKRKVLYSRDQLFKNDRNGIMFPFELRTSHNFYLINELADLYGISLERIRTIAYNAVDMENMSFNEETFRRLTRKHKGEGGINSPYDMVPMDYLAQFQESGQVPDITIRIIEEVKTKFGLKNEVINVIIEYVLNNYNMKLSKNMIETLAATMDRLKIKDYKAAINALKSDEKKYTSKKSKGPETPEWITTNPESKSGELEDIEISEEELEAIMRRLSA